jgi:acetolactate synthase-1/2/3 large subunit
MKASDLFVQCIESEGIEYILGVPGEENADFMMSLEDSQTIRLVLYATTNRVPPSWPKFMGG